MNAISFLFLIFIQTLFISFTTCLKEDARLSTLELILKYGYPAEMHRVTTKDGYILTMHRIPFGVNNNTSTGKRPVIFLQHCILCSSAVFVLTGPKKALGFILADRGYDVWMGNSRGTKYSKEHQKLDVRSSKYWEFSWHEMGVYDLAAEIDYVTKKTKTNKIYYAGHSMGTTMMYALLSTRPEYNQKIRLFVSLSPVAYMSHMKSMVFRILYGPLAMAMRTMGFQEFSPHNGIIATISRFMCEIQAASSLICTNALFLIAGYDSQQLNQTTLPVIFAHIPAGTSTSSLVHYGQNMQTGQFRMFDYGRSRNMIKYKSATPPAYNLSAITAPCAFYRADNDWLADPTDVSKLSEQMPNLVKSYNVPLPAFNHMDFLFAKDVYKLLYKDVLGLLRNY